MARRLFALALQPLVISGEVPCQDREVALTALRTLPLEVFDFHHPDAITAHWARENFEKLGPRFSVELAQRCNLPIREVAFWVDALFSFMATPVENTIRLRVLADAAHAATTRNSLLMERLEALLGLVALLERVVLVADNLDGFASDESAALKLAAFLGALRQSVERLDVILSLNQDIWQSAFVPRLSNGLADRLTEVVIELKPLTEDEMLALLEARVPGLGQRMLDQVDRASAGTHARGLIRAAGVAWLRASAMDAPSRNPAAPSAGGVPLPASQAVQALPDGGEDSPFEIVDEPASPTSPEVAVVVPAPTVSFPPAESPPPSTLPDKDRVDGLLRQLLTRYGQSQR